MIHLSAWSVTPVLWEETDAYSSQRTTQNPFLSSKKGLHSQMKFVCAPSNNAKELTFFSTISKYKYSKRYSSHKTTECMNI